MCKNPDHICNSINEINELVNILPKNGIAFRGQADIENSLQTRIAHHYAKKDKPLVTVNIQAELIIKDFEKKIAENKLHSEIWADTFEFPIKNYKNDWLKIFQGQHIGIPTFVMDWSLSWEVALFFACHKPDRNGQLWVMNLDGLEHNHDSLDINSIYTKNPFSLNKYFFVRPSFNDGWNMYPTLKRFFFQQGAFLIMPSENNVEPIETKPDFKKRLTLINITKECKQEIKILYNKPVKVSPLLKNIHGIFECNGNYFKRYDKSFFYGEISSQLFEVVNDVRGNYEFDKLKVQ